MGVNISIKNVPAEKVKKLKLRAKRNHRSLQGELMALIDRVTAENESGERALSFEEAVNAIKKIALKTPSESARMIREDRDGR